MRKRTQIRLAWLENTLASGGTLHLGEAARHFEVSEMTIRRDVEASEGRLILLAGRLVHTDNPQYAPIYDLDVERDSHRLAKLRICQEAVRWVEPGDTLFVDCGTTLVHMAASLDPNISLTVLTYALNVANAFSQLANVRLMLLGGLYHPSSQSFSGDDVAGDVQRVGINKAFISAAGVHSVRGISCFHFHEVPPKQAAIAAAQERILVADDSKHDQIRPALFAQWTSFDLFITDGTPDTNPATSAGQPSPRVICV